MVGEEFGFKRLQRVGSLTALDATVAAAVLARFGRWFDPMLCSVLALSVSLSVSLSLSLL